MVLGGSESENPRPTGPPSAVRAIRTSSISRSSLKTGVKLDGFTWARRVQLLRDATRRVHRRAPSADGPGRLGGHGREMGGTEVIPTQVQSPGV